MERRPNHLPEEEAPEPLEQEALPPFESEAPKIPEKVKAAELALLAAKKQPEAKLAHVTEAANRNEAVERLYELRHEVKDQAAPQSAVPVGQIVADAPSRQPGLAGMAADDTTADNLAPSATQRPQRLTFRSAITKGSPHRRAVGYGFFGAIFLIISIEIYLLFTG